MNQDFALHPEQASVAAERLDQLYFFLVSTSMFFTALICVLVLFFAIRYRRGARISRVGAPTGHVGLELLWSAVPLVIMLISFFWGAFLYVEGFRPPPDAMEIHVVGKQWMWKVYHDEGRTEINELHVPVGQPVRLKMISEDVIHSFYIPSFRVKQDVLPGRYTSMWFEPTKTGTFHLFCAEYCGTSHAAMRGRVVVQSPEEYASWLARENVSGGMDQASESPASAGERLFAAYQCGSCHKRQASPGGPSLHGLFDRVAVLADGTRVKCDLSYLRRSILEPGSQIAAGYEPRMPTFAGQINEEEILQISAYLESLTN